MTQKTISNYFTAKTQPREKIEHTAMYKLQKKDIPALEKKIYSIPEEVKSEEYEEIDKINKMMFKLKKYSTMKATKIIDDKLRKFPKLVLREWQRKGLILILDSFLKKKKNSTISDVFFASAFPGSGKTTFGTIVAYILMSLGFIDFVVVISPSKNLSEISWPGEFTTYKMELKYGHGAIKKQIKSTIGASITYGHFSSKDNVEHLKNVIKKTKTLCIIDEVHHCCDENTWGRSIEECFKDATYKLLLSGTPFRTRKSEKIPFAKSILKKENGQDFYEYTYDISYSYAECLKDECSKGVIVHSADGLVSWKEGQVKHEYSFIDELKKPLANKRLKQAGAIGNDDDELWFSHSLIQKAIDQTNLLRLTVPEAQCLVTAQSKEHAEKIRCKFNELGENPRFVSSEIEESDIILKNFANNPLIHENKFIISIKMLSEGTNIPNLTVLLCLGNIVTALFTIQLANRVTRFQKNKGMSPYAHIFIPNDSRYIEVLNDMIKATEDYVTALPNNSIKKNDYLKEVNSNNNMKLSPNTSQMVCEIPMENTNDVSENDSNSDSLYNRSKNIEEIPDQYELLVPIRTIMESCTSTDITTSITYDNLTTLSKAIDLLKYDKTRFKDLDDAYKFVDGNKIIFGIKDQDSATIVKNTNIVLPLMEKRKQEQQKINNYIKKHAKILSQNPVLKELTPGEIICTLYSTGYKRMRKYKYEDFDLEDYDTFLETLKQIVTASNIYPESLLLELKLKSQRKVKKK